ncbi:MAG TPA: hypothetical protein VNE62_04365, partial [Actinomycetota bacterium]|nr:hypothetical protein [Actinomycetota bacterium]
MTVDASHPELQHEQAHVDRAYSSLGVMLEEVRGLNPQGRNDYEQEVFDRWKDARIAALSDTKSALVFGRIDLLEPETFYIGRHHVRTPGYETLVVDWRAPVAQSYYRAHRGDRMGLRRRRQFLVEGREILGISDDDFVSAPPGESALRGTDMLEHELARQRGPHMRDIVATIQAEQDAIIRAPLEGVVVVQGGPGTGKTAIGLHRAAFLLYEHRQRLQRMGVLVLGPNAVFMRYVSQVLPSLGESAMTQVPIAGLMPQTGVVDEADPQVARIKGDARMSELVRTALENRCSPQESDAEINVHGVRFLLGADQVNAHADTFRSRGVTFRHGRELLRDALVQDAYRAYVDALPLDTLPDYEEAVRAVRADKAFRAVLDRVWPAMGAETLVSGLLSSADRLARAAEDLLSPDEQKVFRRRPRGKRAWTAPDLPLLDEASALIEGPPDRYGHVVVDEAQDLSPMQLRMVARRCPEGSMSILGDLGQATGVWAHDSWDEVLDHLPNRESARVEELTLGYRVAESIMQVASRVLAVAAPALQAPKAVRREPGEV